MKDLESQGFIFSKEERDIDYLEIKNKFTIGGQVSGLKTQHLP